MSFQFFQWFFKFFSGVWKPNSKSQLSAAWCLLLTPRHEPLGWLATTMFDWRKKKSLEKLWCLSHPTSLFIHLFNRKHPSSHHYLKWSIFERVFSKAIVYRRGCFCVGLSSQYLHPPSSLYVWQVLRVLIIVLVLLGPPTTKTFTSLRYYLLSPSPLFSNIPLLKIVSPFSFSADQKFPFSNKTEDSKKKRMKQDQLKKRGS